MIKAGGVEEIINVIKTYKDDPDICINICGILRNLSYNSKNISHAHLTN